ncbi:diguanylate cyclase [Marinobacter sp. SS13-12]|uniref:sensor domain-containing diguanylate cyclase n=1 Tax=Marinobacter sp. SS13-12 TaxID=3050451 RepID=UPI002554B025|nr:diguanylate cyclase [Marinobacter sp. SS13-12]MDK8462431.1 diguanylate cyclase [Marinobacter sp. SS13-12]
MKFPVACQLWRLLLLALLLAPVPALAQDATVAWVEAAEPETGIEDIRALPESQWQPAAGDETLSFGFSNSSFWLRVKVPAEPFNRVLEIGYPLLDDVRVYWFVGGNQVERHATGDRRVFSSRPIHHRNFVFLVPSNTEPATAYVRVRSEGSVQIPVQVIASSDFLEVEQLDFGWQALFLGIMISMALYNLFIFVIVRHLAYLWYVLTVVASALVLLNFNGLVFQWLWPDLPIINRYFTVPAISANMFFAAMFTLSFLAVRRYSPGAHRFLQLIVLTSIGCFIYGLFGSYQSATVLISVVAAVATPLTWLIGLVVWYRGQVLAGFYVVAWTPLLLGHLVMAVSKIGLIPTNALTETAPQIGVALEVILLSFALAYRINLERQRRIRAQEHALEIQRKANQTLEARVQARTEELEQANEQLKAVSITDGLTQVANRRRFDEKLEAEWNRALRQGHPLSLIMLDIDHFKRVNDDLGHLAGDDCLISIARACADEIQRSGDLLARYGGEEFSVLLPATPEAGAISVAERLRVAVAATPVPVDDQAGPVNLSVSVGVATIIPEPGNRPSDLIARADEALYAAKNAGRNRVMVFRESGAETVPGS